MKSAVVLLLAACSTTPLARVAEVNEPSARTINIEAGRRGFAPAEMRARVTDVVRLVFTRTDDDHCLDKVVLHVEHDRRIERQMPMNRAVAFTLRLDAPGDIGITCAGEGHTAVLVVDP